MTTYDEGDVQKYIRQMGLKAIIDDAESRLDAALPSANNVLDEYDQPEFELWKLLKKRALEKLRYNHRLTLNGEILGSGINLPLDKSRHMFLDLIGSHREGLFILELKIDRPAERNAFTELLGYSNYIAGIFPGIGSKDILNILVTPLLAKIAKQAYLYDLLVANRSTVLYQPKFSDTTADSLRLSLYIPDDTDFQQFANRLLSHNAMSCVVASFEDIPGWIEYDTDNPQNLPSYTQDALQNISSYSAQLMEDEGLHGFCYVRKRWYEIQAALSNEKQSDLIICALNPFRFADDEKLSLVTDQLSEDGRTIFKEVSDLGFNERLCRIAKRVIRDCIDANHPSRLELPHWGGMVTQMIESALTDNIGFRPTGIFRDAYVEQLAATRRYNEAFPSSAIDVERLQVDDIFNWHRAWEFMEACGYIAAEVE